MKDYHLKHFLFTIDILKHLIFEILSLEEIT